MTPSDFQEKLLQLPPDTLITAQHILAILEALRPLPIKDQNYSQWDNYKIIDQNTLAEWLGESPRTIEKWREEQGKGPSFIKGTGKNIRYRVGDVKDWLKKNTYNSIGERQQAKQEESLKKMNSKGKKLSFGGMEWDSFTPTIFVDDKPMPFFETLDPEMNITGYEVKWSEAGSVATRFLEELSKNPKTAIQALQKDKMDLNQISHFLIGETAQERSLAHTVATFLTHETEQYKELVLEMLDSGIDFSTTDEQGRNAIQLAKEHGNQFLIQILSSHSLYWKLKAELPN